MLQVRVEVALLTHNEGGQRHTVFEHLEQSEGGDVNHFSRVVEVLIAHLAGHGLQVSHIGGQPRS